jgi:VIT1/CCC1 family predicted Fe2+/Mn2+ transporter
MMYPGLLRRVAVQAVFVGLAAALLLTALGFLIAALMLALLDVVSPPLATLITALVLALVALFITLMVRARRPRPVARRGPSMGDVAPVLQLAAGNSPWAAMATSVILGAVTELTMKPPPSRRRDA